MPTILVVDDDAALRELLVELLEADGYTVKAVVDGSAAVEAAHEERFDLVVLDVIMPEKGGIETILELHRLDAVPKAIIVSGQVDVDSEHFRSLAEKLGAVKVLAKPFANDELLQAVRDALSSP